MNCTQLSKQPFEIRRQPTPKGLCSTAFGQSAAFRDPHLRLG